MTSEPLEEIVGQLTLEEKLSLVAGRDLWHTNAVDSLGVPSLHLSDGPSGVRGERTVGTTSVSFPCGIAVGATFDPELAHALGVELAGEARSKGAHVLLGPTVNLHRHPLGGRHFESYSEDPLLTARLATAYVIGLQSTGVAATVKHFVCNDTEHERHTISSEVDERTLRELYLVPFEAAVVEGGAWAIMSAYNKVNGTYAAEHEPLLDGVLRREWGFDGAVVSDWFGTKSTVASALAGLDLEMPGPPAFFGDDLATAVREGEVPVEVIDDKVRRLLLLAERTGAIAAEQGAGAAVPTSPDEPAEAARLEAAVAFARRLAAASFVLLRNEPAPGPTATEATRLLPLELSPTATLAVIGPNAAHTAIQGGGSAAGAAGHHGLDPRRPSRPVRAGRRPGRPRPGLQHRQGDTGARRPGPPRVLRRPRPRRRPGRHRGRPVRLAHLDGRRRCPGATSCRPAASRSVAATPSSPMSAASGSSRCCASAAPASPSTARS